MIIGGGGRTIAQFENPERWPSQKREPLALSRAKGYLGISEVNRGVEGRENIFQDTRGGRCGWPRWPGHGTSHLSSVSHVSGPGDTGMGVGGGKGAK